MFIASFGGVRVRREFTTRTFTVVNSKDSVDLTQGYGYENLFRIAEPSNLAVFPLLFRHLKCEVLQGFLKIEAAA